MFGRDSVLLENKSDTGSTVGMFGGTGTHGTWQKREKRHQLIVQNLHHPFDSLTRAGSIMAYHSFKRLQSICHGILHIAVFDSVKVVIFLRQWGGSTQDSRFFGH